MTAGVTPPAAGSSAVTVFAPDGIGEVAVGTDLVALIVDSLAASVVGPLVDGDILVVTSKIISKAEDRSVPGEDRLAVVQQETSAVVARRGPVRIVRTRTGLTMAAGGVDSSNVALGTLLRLPLDPDASAAALRAGLQERTGRRLGVIISDTSGRAWRIGQTDLAVGASGVLVVDRYAGRTDAYGNELAVTAMALGDELAAAADLAKRKLAGRPVALVRGLGELVADDGEPARALVRTPAEDMFGHGSREAVLAALCAVIGRPEAYAELVELDGTALEQALLAAFEAAGRPLTGPAAELATSLLAAAAYP